MEAMISENINRVKLDSDLSLSDKRQNAHAQIDISASIESTK